jgi:hypothetical protein
MTTAGPVVGRAGIGRLCRGTGVLRLAMVGRRVVGRLVGWSVGRAGGRRGRGGPGGSGRRRGSAVAGLRRRSAVAVRRGGPPVRRRGSAVAARRRGSAVAVRRGGSAVAGLRRGAAPFRAARRRARTEHGGCDQKEPGQDQHHGPSAGSGSDLRAAAAGNMQHQVIPSSSSSRSVMVHVGSRLPRP